MASQKRNWFRREVDYWLYCWRERHVILLSVILIFFGVTTISPFGANTGFREIISIICFVVSVVLILIDDHNWKKKFDDMHVDAVDLDRLRPPSDPHRYGVEVYGGRPFLIPKDVNRSMRSRGFQHKKISMLRKPFQLHEAARQRSIIFLEYFHLGHHHGNSKKKVEMWNDKKVRLNSSVEELLTGASVTLQKTSYFDYLGSAFFSSRRFFVNNKLECDGLELMRSGGNPAKPDELASLPETRTAHHIGVNVILFSKDKYVLYQGTKAPASPDSHVPSGSGSLDLEDVNLESFEQTLLRGALRELSEETGWDDFASQCSQSQQKIKEMFCWPLGMSIDLSRGMVTDFFFVVIDWNCTHKQYENYYNDGKAKLDLFELKAKNSIWWRQINTSNLDLLVADIEKFKAENLHRNAMLSLSLEFLLQAIGDQPDVKSQLLS